MYSLHTALILLFSLTLISALPRPDPDPDPSPAKSQGTTVPPLILAISNVSTNLQALNSSIAAIQPGPATLSSLTQVLAASNAVQQSLQAGTALVQNTPGTLTVSEANDLTDQTDALVSQTQTTIAALVARQSILLQAGAGPTTLGVIQAQKSAALSFADALRDKVPSKQKQQKNAAESMADVAKAFDQGIAAFSVSAPGAPAPAPANATVAVEGRRGVGTRRRS